MKNKSHRVRDTRNNNIAVKIKIFKRENVGLDRVIGLVTRYALDGPAIEP